MIYTYVIVPKPLVSLPLPDGLRSPLAWEVAGNLAAVVEANLALETLETDNKLLLQAVVHHDRIVRYLFARMTVLPLRFGTYFLSLDRLREHLRASAAVYESELQRLAERAEFSLKLFLAEPPDTPDIAPSSGRGGRAYFLAKKQRHQDLQALKARQQQEKQDLVAAIAAAGMAVLALDPDESGNERLCFLGDRAGVARDVWEQWRATAPSWHLQISEALPPYHFMEVTVAGSS